MTIVAALGSCLIAGVFFIFSVAIMRALERVPGGMSLVQSINLVIINPMFLGVFLATGVLCLVLTISSILRWQQTGSALLLAVGLLYLIGSIAVTMIFNVPMNNALAAADSTSLDGQRTWSEYLVNWTFWNHIRTIASLLASASFIISIAQMR